MTLESIIKNHLKIKDYLLSIIPVKDMDTGKMKDLYYIDLIIDSLEDLTLTLHINREEYEFLKKEKENND